MTFIAFITLYVSVCIATVQFKLHIFLLKVQEQTTSTWTQQFIEMEPALWSPSLRRLVSLSSSMVLYGATISWYLTVSS